MVKQLFRGHKDLILGFRAFLPQVGLPASTLGVAQASLCVSLHDRWKPLNKRHVVHGYEISVDEIEEIEKVCLCILCNCGGVRKNFVSMH